MFDDLFIDNIDEDDDFVLESTNHDKDDEDDLDDYFNSMDREEKQRDREYSKKGDKIQFYYNKKKEFMKLSIEHPNNPIYKQKYYQYGMLLAKEEKKASESSEVLESTDWSEKELPDIFDEENDDYQEADYDVDDDESNEEEIDEFLDELGITDEDIELMDDEDFDEDFDDATEGTKLTKSQKTALKIINSKPVAVTNVLIYDTIGKRVEQNNHNIYYKKYLKYKELSKRNPQNQLFKKKKTMYYILSTAMTAARHQSYKTLNKALKAKESAEYFEFDPVMEADALTNDLNKLASMDGSQEEEPDDEEGGEDVGENGKPLAPKPKSTDVAGEADKQLEEEGQTVDELDMMEDQPQEDNGTDADTEDNGNPDTEAEQTRDDPLKSIETKRAYKNKFVYLYNVITDSLNAMESFTPEYTSPLAQDYYTIRSNLTKLKQIIYKICVERISKMTVDEVLRKYSTANHIFDISANQLKEFFDKYAKERNKLMDKKIKLSDTKESESKRKKKLHIN